MSDINVPVLPFRQHIRLFLINQRLPYREQEGLRFRLLLNPPGPLFFKSHVKRRFGHFAFPYQFFFGYFHHNEMILNKNNESCRIKQLPRRAYSLQLRTAILPICGDRKDFFGLIRYPGISGQTALIFKMPCQVQTFSRSQDFKDHPIVHLSGKFLVCPVQTACHPQKLPCYMPINCSFLAAVKVYTKNKCGCKKIRLPVVVT